MPVDRDTDEMTINLLAQPYARLHTATLTGDEFDVLAALRDLANACPEVVAWLARETNENPEFIEKALDCVRSDAQFDDSAYLSEQPDIVDLIDDAKMFGTLDDVLATLKVKDEKAARTISIRFEMGTEPIATFDEIGRRLGVGGEMCKRYQKRGFRKIRSRMEARVRVDQLRARMEARGRT